MGHSQPPTLPSFEVLAQLARDDPNAYEALRREAIESVIDGVAEEKRPRLRGLQFRIDSERRLSHSALGTAVRVYELMWKSFLTLNHNCQDLAYGGERVARVPTLAGGTRRSPARGADIIAFRTPRDKR